MSDQRNNPLSGDGVPNLHLVGADGTVIRPDTNTPHAADPPVECGGRQLDNTLDHQCLVHELANMLDGSLRNVSLTLRQMRDTSEPTDPALAQLDTAEATLKDMATLIGQWREHGADAAYGDVVPQHPGTLGDAIDLAIKLTDPLAGMYSITIDTNIDPTTLGLPLGALKPVLVNALRNAVEAMAATGRIELITERTGDHVEICITDTGPGIDPELNRDRDGLPVPGHSTKTGGQGLGLAISRDLVRALGGVIRLEDHTDGGAALILRVPVARGSHDV